MWRYTNTCSDKPRPHRTDPLSLDKTNNNSTLSHHELITDKTDIMLEDYRDGQVYWWRVKERVLNKVGDSFGNKSGLHPNSHLLEMNSGKASRLSRSMALPSDPVKVMAKRCPWRRLSLHPAREAGEGRGTPRSCGREKFRRSLGKA